MVVAGRNKNFSHPGHRQFRNGKKIDFLYGNGCREAPDCLECPRDDCHWDGSKWQGSLKEPSRSRE